MNEAYVHDIAARVSKLSDQEFELGAHNLISRLDVYASILEEMATMSKENADVTEEIITTIEQYAKTARHNFKMIANEEDLDWALNDYPNF